MRARVRSRLRWRMISWPALKPMRWVKPSMATVSPSRTRSATASRIEATLPGMALSCVVARGQRPEAPKPWVARPSFVACATSATSSARWVATCATASVKSRTAVSASVWDTTSGGDIRTQSSPASRTRRPAVERLHLDGLGGLAGVELDADHEALAADVADERREPVHGAAARPS